LGVTSSAAVTPPEFVPDWHEMLSSGIEMRSGQGVVRIVEFVDLECPGCSFYHREVLSEVLQQFDGQVSVTFMHLPGKSHRFARPAAIAAECANEQGRFSRFVENVLSQQDSLGLIPWSVFAQSAGIEDSARFERCVETHESFPRIEAGIEWARSLQVRATPTIIVNGWYFQVPPSPQELERVVSEIAAGREPFDLPTETSDGR
jgi:protein-disulfide isomerase